VIGQSVFPGEALARSLALSSQPISETFVRSVALSSQPISEAFVRSVALTDQSPVGFVATSGPVIGQSVFPGEALARSLALSSQAWVDYYGGK